MEVLGIPQHDDQLMVRVFEAWRTLRRGAVRKLNLHFYGSGPDALDPSQMDVLDVIATRPAWRMTQLAKELYLDPSTVTRAVDRLADHGLVMRVPSGDDGRGIEVRATAAGSELCQTVAERRRGIMRTVLRDMTPGQCEHIASSLERMVAGVSAYAAALDDGDRGSDLPELSRGTT
jgi:DNA-binding MarR family transcriptional regulator